jgi:uncharacterized DUF497 family protein
MVDTEEDGSPFVWDDANVEHIARHGVEWWEVDEVLLNPNRQRLSRAFVADEQRFAVIGETLEGRLLVVAYTHRNGRTRPLMARPPSAREAQSYRRRE